jgi:hypothetical protein
MIDENMIQSTYEPWPRPDADQVSVTIDGSFAYRVAGIGVIITDRVPAIGV